MQGDYTMELVMPLDEWLMNVDFSPGDPKVQKAINLILSKGDCIYDKDPWLDICDLPDDLKENYDELKEDYVLQWCKVSKEFKSLSELKWDTLHVLPFSSTAARVSAVFLKEVAKDTWEGRDLKIHWLDVPPKIGSEIEWYIGVYAVSLWDVLSNINELDRSLNTTACPGYLTAASIIIASFERTPVYIWSEQYEKLLSLPIWEMPFLYDKEREDLKGWINDTKSLNDLQQSFIGRWKHVIGINPKTTTALILRNWFKWKGSFHDLYDGIEI